ncbi:hypothetical protein Trydic_g19054 [Trypoxylus dichotomus]
MDLKGVYVSCETQYKTFVWSAKSKYSCRIERVRICSIKAPFAGRFSPLLSYEEKCCKKMPFACGYIRRPRSIGLADIASNASKVVISMLTTKNAIVLQKSFKMRILRICLILNHVRQLKCATAALNVDRSIVGKRLHALGMVQKAGNWVPHELKERDIEGRLVTCQNCFNNKRERVFLHRIITGDEKFIHYGNSKRKLGEPGASTPKAQYS